ncbi:MAG: GIY-YIG nuclease family protein [Lachnospiraceae bacterium]|nr:GIY-YIG nuclease family protein [Lachnospiraceae bacterium]
MIGIYKITNTKNGKVYIGQSVDIAHRKSCHEYDLKNNRHGNLYLQHAYNKDPDVFKLEVICLCKEEDLDELEKFYIDKYNSADHRYGYNIDSSPRGTGRKSEETKRKLSEAKKGNTVMCGMRLSEEWKKHLSEAQPHKKKVECIETGEIYESFADAARKTGLNRTKIVSVCTGKRHKTGGLHFRYADEKTGD